MKYIPLILGAGALVLGLWLGYQWGARGLDKAQLELAQIRSAEGKAKAEFEASTKRLQDQMRDLETQHQANVAKIETASAAQRQQLETSLARANERLQSAQGKVRDVDVQIQRVRNEAGSATGEQKKLLDAKEVELTTLRTRLQQQSDSIACLQMPVPGDELNILRLQLAGNTAGERL